MPKYNPPRHAGLRSELLRIASGLPKGNTTRKEILAAILKGSVSRNDRRYVDSDDRRAKLVAWSGGMDMGGWTDTNVEDFLDALQDESVYGGGSRLNHVEIQDTRTGRVLYRE